MKGIVFKYERLRSTGTGTKGNRHPSNKGGSSTDGSRCSNNGRQQLMTDDDNCRGVLCNSASMSFTRLSKRMHSIPTRCTRNPLKGFAPFLGLNPSMTLPRKPTVSAIQPLPKSPCFPFFFENNKFQEREAGQYISSPGLEIEDYEMEKGE